ncbi:Imm32 family immunity protein [Deinococcus sp.]|uniref:Imm32 family immunity protein n=1 Tax=Deinococcus sp. TaxID=47478 RepID=UPI003CC5C299
MLLQIEIPDPRDGEGLTAVWERDFEIEVNCMNGQATISANKAGLVSLARHLLLLAQDSYPPGHHWHFDDLNSLENGSCELTIDKR